MKIDGKVLIGCVLFMLLFLAVWVCLGVAVWDIETAAVVVCTAVCLLMIGVFTWSEREHLSRGKGCGRNEDL